MGTMMGTMLAKAYVLVGAESTLEGDLDDIENQSKGMFSSLAAGILAVTAPMAAFGAGVLRQGVSAAATFEETVVEMETMIGSAAETQKTLTSLTAFAAATPFEMPQLLSVAKQLIMFDERGDKLMDTIKLLGDASGGTAEKFGILGMVFNQIRGVGHLLTQDFRQLSSRGIISMQDIAKFYGVSTAAADEMISSGKVSFEDFRAIMKGLTEEGGRFANMMLKQSTTMKGLTSTMNDAYNITVRLLVTPILPWAKALTTSFISLLGVLGGVVEKGGAVVSFAFAGATAFASMATAVVGFGVALYVTGAALKVFGVSWKMFMIGTGIGAVIVLVGALLGALVGLFSMVKGPMAAFSGLWKGLSDWVQKYIDVFNKWVTTNQFMFGEVWLIVEDFANKMSKIFFTVIEVVTGAFAMFGFDATRTLVLILDTALFVFTTALYAVMTFVNGAVFWFATFRDAALGAIWLVASALDTVFRTKYVLNMKMQAEVLKEEQLQKEMDRVWNEAMKPKKQKNDDGPKSPSMSLETGRYGLTGFYDKFQDKLLGKNKDTGAQQVELAKQGLEKQDELIKVMKGQPKPGMAE